MSAAGDLPPYDGVVLAGGESRRLGGTDKALLEVGGTTFLDAVLGALDGAQELVVAGGARPTARPVRFCREDPPGGGPVAGIAAALAATSAEVLVVVAVDLPLVDRPTVERLVRALDGPAGPEENVGAAPGPAGPAGSADVAVLVDATGSDQPLLAAYRRTAVTAAVGDAPSGRSVRSVVRGLHTVRVPDRHEVCVDAGTWEGVAEVRRRFEARAQQQAEEATDGGQPVGRVAARAGTQPGGRVRR